MVFTTCAFAAVSAAAVESVAAVFHCRLIHMRKEGVPSLRKIGSWKTWKASSILSFELKNKGGRQERFRRQSGIKYNRNNINAKFLFKMGQLCN
jgi:hypothetical protein